MIAGGVGIAIALVTGAAIVHRKAYSENPRQALAARLERLGYPRTDAGVIILDTGTGLQLAYDPNLDSPTFGLRKCAAGITACIAHDPDRDACFRNAPLCQSAKPWKDDPGGDTCCPKSCVDEYFERRKTATPSVAFREFIRGYCYPGTREEVTGVKK